MDARFWFKQFLWDADNPRERQNPNEVFGLAAVCAEIIIYF